MSATIKILFWPPNYSSGNLLNSRILHFHENEYGLMQLWKMSRCGILVSSQWPLTAPFLWNLLFYQTMKDGFEQITYPIDIKRIIPNTTSTYWHQLVRNHWNFTRIWQLAEHHTSQTVVMLMISRVLNTLITFKWYNLKGCWTVSIDTRPVVKIYFLWLWHKPSTLHPQKEFFIMKASLEPLTVGKWSTRWHVSQW